jgi:hypothetical protein
LLPAWPLLQLVAAFLAAPPLVAAFLADPHGSPPEIHHRRAHLEEGWWEASSTLAASAEGFLVYFAPPILLLDAAATEMATRQLLSVRAQIAESVWSAMKGWPRVEAHWKNRWAVTPHLRFFCG